MPAFGAQPFLQRLKTGLRIVAGRPSLRICFSISHLLSQWSMAEFRSAPPTEPLDEMFCTGFLGGIREVFPLLHLALRANGPEILDAMHRSPSPTHFPYQPVCAIRRKISPLYWLMRSGLRRSGDGITAASRAACSRFTRAAGIPYQACAAASAP
jgi:hypothetical protein